MNDIGMTYSNFGHLNDDGYVHITFTRWLHLVLEGEIQLRVLLAQAAGLGLTSLDMIAEAITSHDDFPWQYI